jgi:hypothetical protein
MFHEKYVEAIRQYGPNGAPTIRELNEPKFVIYNKALKLRVKHFTNLLI